MSLAKRSFFILFSLIGTCVRKMKVEDVVVVDLPVLDLERANDESFHLCSMYCRK